MNRVRFHLGAGRHFGHWQIRSKAGVEYVDPAAASLILRGCKLVNSPRVAKRIHAGEHKTPCAWIECESVESRPSQAVSGEVVRYNPRVEPHWIFRGGNADGTAFASLMTCGRSVVLPIQVARRIGHLLPDTEDELGWMIECA